MFGGAKPVNGFASKRWMSAKWSIGQLAAIACCLEAAAPKAGNVHPSAAFVDMDFSDFLLSGLAIAPTFDAASKKSVGELVFEGVRATRERLELNTNLGTLLLLAPLAKGLLRWQATHADRPTADQLRLCVQSVLDDLDAHDTELVYAAIRLAKPGGLGRAEAHDVSQTPPANLRTAMAVVAKVDAVARQYVSGFADVCGPLATWLRSALARGLDLSQAIVEVQLRWLAEECDGLIVRKAGQELAEEVRGLAGIALEEWLETGQRGLHWQMLDTFLRADGHRRNPGTTADLIAAALLVLLVTEASS
jgi:triphosphoribosyl-dephospho-CoA synthase